MAANSLDAKLRRRWLLNMLWNLFACVTPRHWQASSPAHLSKFNMVIFRTTDSDRIYSLMYHPVIKHRSCWKTFFILDFAINLFFTQDFHWPHVARGYIPLYPHISPWIFHDIPIVSPVKHQLPRRGPLWTSPIQPTSDTVRAKSSVEENNGHCRSWWIAWFMLDIAYMMISG